MKIRNYHCWLLAVFLWAGISSCKKEGRSDEREKPLDSLVQKLDSVTDSVAEDVKDVNEGVGEGLDELKEKTDGDSLIFK